MTRTTLLEATSVRVRRGRDEVVRGVDLAVADGEVVAILSPNGAGKKSTLLDALGGILRPSAGIVHRHGKVATVMQSPGMAPREALVQMRAEHLGHRPAGALSGGERRRVHLARAVAIRPDVLLLDEPFAGLDPQAMRSCVTIRRRPCVPPLARPSSSFPSEAWALADRVLVMFAGEVVADGAPDHVLEHPPNIEVARFLGYDGELRDRPASCC